MAKARLDKRQTLAIIAAGLFLTAIISGYIYANTSRITEIHRITNIMSIASFIIGVIVAAKATPKE